MADSYSSAVAVYDGPASAQAVVNRLKGLQKEKALDIEKPRSSPVGAGARSA